MAHTFTDQFHYESTAVSSRTFTLTQNFPSGTTIIGGLVTTSAGSQITMSSVTDSKSNTWTPSAAGSTSPPETFNASTVQVHQFFGTITTGLVAGDTVTITLGATTSRWDVSLEGFDDLTATPFDKKATNTGTSASMSSGTTAATTQATELIMCAYGYGSTHNANIPTGWSGSGQVATTGGSNDRALQMVWKYVTATGTQTNTTTLDSSSVYAGCIATYKQTAFSSSTFTPGSATSSDSTQATAWTLTIKPAGSVTPPPTTTGGVVAGTSGTQGNTDSQHVADVAHIEQVSLRTLPIYRMYNSYISDPWFGSTSSETILANSGHQICMSAKPWPSSGKVSWASVKNGSIDTYLHQRAAEAIAFGQQFYLTIHHEPDGQVDNTAGSGWTWTDYVNMQRHIIDLFNADGATNVLFGTCWVASPDAGHDATMWNGMYAGDSYMDWVGFDPYNKYSNFTAANADLSTVGSAGETGPTYGLDLRFARWLNNFYNWNQSYCPTKPVFICEIGINEFGDDGTLKAAQYPKLLKWLKYATNVQALMHFYGKDSVVNWYADSTAKALAGWQTFINDAWFFPSTTGGPPPSNNQTGTLTVAATATPVFRGANSALSGTLTVSAVASPFFVGSGSGGGATSTSNFPVTKVEAQFGGVWTDITAYVASLDGMHAEMEKGRTFELDEVEATTCGFMLNNTDGRFDPTNTSSPYYPNVTVLCPVRWTNQWKGVAYSTFTGYIERWPQEWEMVGLYGKTDPLATDALALLAQQKLIAAWVGQAKAFGATAIYPLTDGSADRSTPDLLGAGPSGALVNKSGGTVTLGAESPVAGTGGAVFTTGGYIRFPKPFYTHAIHSVEIIGTINSANAVFGQGTYADTIGNGVNLSSRLLPDPLGGLHYTVDDGAGHEAPADAPGGTFDPGELLHIVGLLDTDKKTARLYVNGVQVAAAASGTTLSDQTANPAPPVFLGNATSNVPFDGLDGTIYGVAVYDNVALTASQVQTLYQATLGFPGQRTDQRAQTIVSQAGWAGPVQFDVGAGTMATADFTDQSVLTLLKDVAAVEGTSLYVDGGGVLTINNRATLQNPVSMFTFGENTGEIHYEDIQFDYDPTYLYNEVTVSRPSGGTVSAKATTTYPGTRTYDLTLACGSDGEALSAAQHYLAMYKDAHLRVSSLTFNSTALKDYTAALSLDIGDFVTVNRRQPGRPAMSGLFAVQHIAHTVQAGEWKTTLGLSPADPTKYLILDSTTSGYRLDEGALSW